ncbi:MAG: hypothetical protein V1888_01110 [archaeon]
MVLVQEIFCLGNIFLRLKVLLIIFRKLLRNMDVKLFSFVARLLIILSGFYIRVNRLRIRGGVVWDDFRAGYLGKSVYLRVDGDDKGYKGAGYHEYGHAADDAVGNYFRNLSKTNNRVLFSGGELSNEEIIKHLRKKGARGTSDNESFAVGWHRYYGDTKRNGWEMNNLFRYIEATTFKKP